MTDRYHSLTVTFGEDVRDDDAEIVIEAIKMFRGVISVKGNVSDLNTHVARERVRLELGKKLLGIVYPDLKE